MGKKECSSAGNIHPHSNRALAAWPSGSTRCPARARRFGRALAFHRSNERSLLVYYEPGRVVKSWEWTTVNCLYVSVTVEALPQALLALPDSEKPQCVRPKARVIEKYVIKKVEDNLNISI